MDSAPYDGRRIVAIQVAWAILAAIWNVAGVALIAQGLRAPGPTASIIGAFVMLVLAVAFVTTIHRWPLVYLLASVIGGLAAVAAVVNAFTADTALWPSEFWRYAGIALNGAGFLAAVFAVASTARERWFN